MRTLGLIILIHFLCASANAAGNIDLNFSMKGYQFSFVLIGEKANLFWKKSGFEVKRDLKLKACHKSIVESESKKIRDSISSKNRKKLLGQEAVFSWNSRSVKRSLLPKEMDQLDKRFTHFFNLIKLGEGKCIK